MLEIMNNNKDEKILLLGAEAITRGALEANVDVATTYPGTPSSEIADTFSKIATIALKQNKDPGFYFEYSVNEKVALEVAAAASLCGLRSLTCMKHVGLNVASDSFMTYPYIGCKGGHIIVSADDPNCHSSQNEQDNRYFALFGSVPMLEPTTPQEAKEMTRVGFDISEDLHLPILLRTTTRLSYSRGSVILNNLQNFSRKGHFEKDPSMITTPEIARVGHPELLRKMKQAENLSEKSPFNTIIQINKPSDIGIVTSGVSFNYAKDIAKILKLNVRILKLGMTHPLPRVMCENFIKSCKTLVIIEELEPILENQFKEIAFDIHSNVRIYGKSTGHFSRLFEYTPNRVAEALLKIFDIENPILNMMPPKLKLPRRLPSLCPGCPYRPAYYAVKKVAPEFTIFPTDIGCYTLGRYPPLEVADLLLCMGSNAGTAGGFAIATDQKIISFMGDSTFFHAGIPPVINAVHHNYDCVITILDNRTTAMTGYQPHPGTEYDGMGRPAKLIKIEDVVKGLGVEHIEIIDPNYIEKAMDAFIRALEFKGPAVVVSKSPCIHLVLQKKRRSGVKVPVYSIDQEKCKQCKICIDQFGCPTFYYKEDGSIFIDDTICTGCGNCVQICPYNAIYIKEEIK
jgi:indolepyruvate ferredoxin oxidoreductase alpha subunit